MRLYRTGPPRCASDIYRRGAGRIKIATCALRCDATDDDEVTNPKIEIERRDVHAVGALPAAALDDRRDFAKEAALRRLGHT